MLRKCGSDSEETWGPRADYYADGRIMRGRTWMK